MSVRPHILGPFTLLLASFMRVSLILFALVLILMVSGSPHVAAHDLRDNQLLLSKKSSDCLTLTFLLRPIDTLHSMLASTQDWISFFNNFSTLEDSEFKIQAERIQSILMESTLIVDGNNLPMPLKFLSVPDPRGWRGKVKEERILLLARANNFGHSLPVEFRAEACSRAQIDRIQISVDARLFPVEVVAHESDHFWLKSDVLSATADF